MQIPYTQYLRPDGRRAQHDTYLDDDLADQWAKVKDAGLTLTMEVLMNNMVSIALEDSELGDDYTGRIVTNDASVLLAVAELVRMFDPDEYRERQAHHEEFGDSALGEE